MDKLGKLGSVLGIITEEKVIGKMGSFPTPLHPLLQKRGRRRCAKEGGMYRAEFRCKFASASATHGAPAPVAAAGDLLW